MIAIALCLMLLAVCAAAETTETMDFQLGTSALTMKIPNSYVPGDLTEEDVQHDQVAYMVSSDSLLDFDVYQFTKDGLPETLAEYVQMEAEEFAATEVVTDAKINGIDAAYYRTVESYDGEEYATLTYVFEDGEDYLEICFWLDGENAEAEVKNILDTLSRK